MILIVSVLAIPFRFTFSHASADRKKSSSVFVEIHRGAHVGYGEGCPREYVTGETIESAVGWIDSIRNSLAGITTIAALRDWVSANDSVINRHPSAWCAVETAFIDLIGKESGRTVEQLLNLTTRPSNSKVSAVIGDGSLKFVESMLDICLEFGFTDFKIKLSGILDRDLEKISMLRTRMNDGYSVRADFNNAFSAKDVRTFIRYLEKINYPFSAIEEPFEPYSFNAAADIAEKFNTPVVLDESFVKLSDLNLIREKKDLVPNIRISKIGGLIRTLKILAVAGQDNMPIILGTLVGETSILTRLWYCLLNQTDHNICAVEGGYSTHLLEEDITACPIIVEPPGIIASPEKMLKSPGLGIDISAGASKYLTRAG
jgi:L-alanine-DL-glutamate epimerase-like enolase superfamily enzyme